MKTKRFFATVVCCVALTCCFCACKPSEPTPEPQPRDSINYTIRDAWASDYIVFDRSYEPVNVAETKRLVVGMSTPLTADLFNRNVLRYENVDKALSASKYLDVSQGQAVVILSIGTNRVCERVCGFTSNVTDDNATKYICSYAGTIGHTTPVKNKMYEDYFTSVLSGLQFEPSATPYGSGTVCSVMDQSDNAWYWFDLDNHIYKKVNDTLMVSTTEVDSAKATAIVVSCTFAFRRLQTSFAELCDYTFSTRIPSGWTKIRELKYKILYKNKAIELTYDELEKLATVTEFDCEVFANEQYFDGDDVGYIVSDVSGVIQFTGSGDILGVYCPHIAINGPVVEVYANFGAVYKNILNMELLNNMLEK